MINKRSLLILGILIIGLFFRTYRLADLMEFGHEQDLQSWIVKDIVVDGHQRLIGQETSVTGVFIGSLYNYFEVIGYKISNMDPIGGYIPLTIVSLATIISVYWVLSKLYGKQIGIIGSIIYSASPTIIFLDRWMVPTQYTLIWTVWFYYITVQFFRGKFTGLPILIVLTSLIWHIHIAFIPLMILPLMAAVYWRHKVVPQLKLINRKYLMVSVVIATILFLPLVAFESRHGWQQLKALTKTLNQDNTILKGLYRWEIVTWNINRILWSPLINHFVDWNIHKTNIYTDFGFLSLFILAMYRSYKQKLIPKSDLILILLWIGNVTISQGLSLRPISEYYFNNLLIISIFVFAIIIAPLSRGKIKWVVIVFGSVWLLGSFKYIISKPQLNGEYIDKKNLVEYLSTNYKNNGYACAGVNFVGDLGTEYGYRYLIWKNGINQVAPNEKVPIYNIFTPASKFDELSMQKFGYLGVTLADKYKYIGPSACNNPSRPLYPLNGFVN